MKVNPETWTTIERGEFIRLECTPHMKDGDMQKAANELIMKIAKRANIPLLLTLDSHFVLPEEKVVQDLSLQNGRGEDMGMRYHTSYHMLSTEDAWQNWQKIHGSDKESTMAFEEAVENNAVMASRCETFSYKKEFRLPEIHVPIEISSKHKNKNDALLEYTLDLVKRYGRMPDSEEYTNRLNTELDVICNNSKINLLPYFITLHDICCTARNIGITIGPGRGSAGGCLLAYLMNIVQKDPIKYGLSFERFLSQGRINRGKLPDIDMDFSEPDRLAKALKDIYGDKIVRVCTTGTNKVKNAIKDVSRVYLDTKNNPEMKEYVDRVCKGIAMIPQGTEDLNKWLDGYQDENDVHEQGELERNSELALFFKDHAEVEEITRAILNVPKSIGRHAAAYCIADKPIHEIVPLCTVSGETCTQFTMGPIEDIGLIKFDMLGINTLKDISACIKIIKERHGLDIDIYNLPEDDALVFKDFYDGETATVFQFNGHVPTKVCKDIVPSCLMDLSNITAACRPGTMYAECEDHNGDTTTLLQLWIDRRSGVKPISYIHPSLEPILSSTDGIFIYQEQINRMFVDCCGYTPEKADEIREIIGKKKKDKMDEIIPDIRHRLSENGWNAKQVSAIISLCVAASSYVFNASHSLSYSYVGYVCMWLKHYYPLEWWTGILQNSNHKDLEANAKYFEHYILPPDVNVSDLEFFIIDGQTEKIVYPLSIIKGVKNAAEFIVGKKPFASMEDFLNRVEKRKVNKRVVLAMLWAGAFDRMPEAGHYKTIWGKRNSLYKFYCKYRKEPEPEELPKSTILFNESESICMGQPDIESLFKERFPNAPITLLSGVEDMKPKSPATVIGVISDIRAIKTKKGDDMCFLALANGAHSISVTVFPKDYELCKHKLVVKQIVSVRGKVDEYNGKKSLVTESMVFYDIAQL